MPALRRNITQRLFTNFPTERRRSTRVDVQTNTGTKMPGCLRAIDHKTDSREAEWREPPGYLGEAVRRAKLIPRRPPPDAPPD